LCGIAALFAAIANWLAALVNGVSPDSLHRFLAAYVRYQTHVYAYLFLIADPFAVALRALRPASDVVAS
jgi:hypothetical protein